MTTSRSPIALTHVTLLDGTEASPQPEQTILLEEDRIVQIGATSLIAIPEHAAIFNLGGKYVMPALWDMHVNALFPGLMEWQHPLMIANGIVGMRDFGSDPTTIETYRQEIASGARLSPTFTTPGPMLDGIPPGNPVASLPVTRPEEVPSVLEALASAGASFFCLQSLLPRDVVKAVLTHAGRLGKKVTGQGLLALSLIEASDLGISSFETLTGFFEASTRDADRRREKLYQETLKRHADGTNTNPLAMFVNDGVKERMIFSDPPEENVSAYNRSSAQRVAERFARNGTFFSPQLVLIKALATLPTLQHDPRRRYVPQTVLEMWEGGAMFQPVRFDQLNAHKVNVAQRFLEVALEIVGLMHQAGVPLLAGTHTVLPYVYPGFDLHSELALLVRAGLSPQAALRTATVNAAQYLGTLDTHGTLEVGKHADLLVLDKNPLADIANIQAIHMLIHDGKVFDCTTLTHILASVEETAKAI